MLRKILALSAALLALPSLVPLPGGNQIGALRAQEAGYRMRFSVMGAAGTTASGTDFRAAATLGQPTPTGILTGAGEILYAGFWGPSSALTPADNPEAPLVNMLFQNYPNPFNPTTAIDYSVAATCFVEITIYDVGGRRIKTLVNETREPGLHKALWDGRNDRGAPAATGLYFYRARIGEYSRVRKMVILR